MDTMKKRILRDVLPILIGAIALIISIKSCTISQRALSISSSEFQLSRSLVLTGNFSEDQNELKLKPLSEDMKVITLAIYEPSKAFEKEVVFTRGFIPESTPPGTLSKPYIDSIREVITKHHQEYDCNGLPSGVLIYSRIPVLIETSYLVKGDKVSDTSIYTMKYMFLRINDKDCKTVFSNVSFINFEFDTRLAIEDWRNTLLKLRSGKPWVLKFDGKQTILRVDKKLTYTKFDGLDVRTEEDSNK